MEGLGVLVMMMLRLYGVCRVAAFEVDFRVKAVDFELRYTRVRLTLACSSIQSDIVGQLCIVVGKSL